MAQVKISLDGTEINELTLLKGREYIVGRSDTCDIVLSKSSVSRQHLKLFFDGEDWQIQVLSKFSFALFEGSEIQNLKLSESLVFFIEGFEFKFIADERAIKKDSSSQTYIPVAGSMLNPEHSHTNVPALKNEDLDEKTSVGSALGTPCLQVSNEGTGEETLFTLEGNSWIIGRSSSSQIQINEPKSSRSHFELTRTSSGFEVTDLGSSNGTWLNGEKIEAGKPVPLGAGDRIRVGFTILEFQIRDPQYEARLNEIPEHLLTDSAPLQLDRTSSVGFPEDRPISNGPNVLPYKPHADKASKNKLYIKIAIGVLACVIIYGSLGEEEGELDQTSVPSGSQKDSKDGLESLSKEQKKLLEDTHKLAKNLYIQGKYESALIEVKKIHAIVPFYSDSKEIELYSQQAVEIKMQQDDINRRDEEAKVIKSRVARIVEECEQKTTATTKIEQVQNCLAPALELDPENAQAQALITKAAKTDEDRQQRERIKENLQSQTRTGNSLYQRARELEASSKLLDAISTYEKYIQSSFPDPQGNKPRARQAVSQLRIKIRNDIKERLAMAEKFKSEEKHKDALKALTKAIELDPADSSARSMYESIQQDLNKKMKSFYGDSVIEENLGNIEAAKQKWRLIRETALEGSDYYLKASRKLNKYGN
jgi:pSer/pThr/pTyr-binding forkhead associated (FHA) protein